MNSRHTLIAGVFVLALGGATPTWSQPVTIANAPNPPADAVAIPAGSRERAVQELPRVVAEIMKRSQVPGMAVAVVVDGKTVLTQSYGTREVGKQAPVDAHTVFQIASISKSLSATVAAIEVSQGKAAWDDPVSRYLPDFKLGNAYVSEHATIGDYFAHRSGLPGTAGDDLEDLGFSRNEVLARLRLLPLDAFRTSYHYANFSTTIGAEAVAKAAGRPWEALADEQLFKPLGMKSTSYRYRDFEAHTNRAVLHDYQNGRFVPAGQRDADQQAPAGGVSSTVVDLAEWLKLLLADGQYQGKAMISPAALLPALSPQAFSARAHDLDSRSGFYGYGFNVNTELGGRPSMGHSGAFLMGTGTTFRIVPSAGIGIVVLTNGAPVGAAESVAASFIDTALYGKPTRDWFAAYNGAMKAFFEPQADLSGQADPARPAAPQALSQYTGRFDNPYYGPAEIQEANGALTLVLGPKGMRFPMRHWDGDTFAFSPAGEAELVASLASLSFGKSQGQVQDFDIKFYGDNGLGRWTRK
ncbi:serine hydrolase [Achromobacter insolitus]|uniref:serine hydrolase n=1 Tax=Achromobacter insolitus TaxID=217204 RepID=UPI00244ED8B2|nr:serine hydrolase [Achromobacter insolitus]MDH3062791.1 serine hydrolase [Achromobacter insolitus]